MENDEWLARIELDARLYGPNETRRVTCAVLTVLGELLPAPACRRLFAGLPAELRQRLPRPGAGRISPVTGCRAFVARVGDRLHVDGPNAAFLARVVLGRLNAAGPGWAPSKWAQFVPEDLRPLLRAWPADVEGDRPAAAITASRRRGADRCRRLPSAVHRSRRRIRRSMT